MTRRGTEVSSSPEVTRREGSPAAPRHSRRRRLARALPLLVVLIGFLGFWELLSRAEIVSPVILPPPTEVGRAFIELSGEAFFWNATRVTMIETLAGFAIGSVAGLLLGALIGTLRIFRSTIYPYAIAFNNLPRIALAPVFLTWFGFGIASKIVLAATICFFPPLIAVVVGIDTVDQDAKSLMRSFGASRWKTFTSLTFPSSLPHVFAGLVNAMSLALIGAIVAEFVGATEGLGVLIETFNFRLNVAEAFALIIALGLIGLGLYGAMQLLYRRIVYWHDK
jgi:NitT/TauT family transport system permease protein